MRPSAYWVLAAIILAALWMAWTLRGSAKTTSFERVVIDPTTAGDCKMVADIDGDGLLDLVIGGTQDSEALVWYHNPDWKRTRISNASREFTTLGVAGDIDGDGDMDIVVPDGDGPDNLLWFENPRPAGDPSQGSQWKRHVAGTIGGWGKDLHAGDMDGDGRTDLVAHGREVMVIFFRDGPDQWVKVQLRGFDSGKEGLGAGDLDGDGDVDLVSRGVWLENPGKAAARDGGQWKVHPIGQFDKDFKAVAADINGDGRMEVVTCSSEGVADLAWWEPSGGDVRGKWAPHVVTPGLEKSHTLQVADMDGDGRLDIVTGQMHTSKQKEIVVWHNVDGAGRRWEKEVISRGEGMHNGVVADIDSDGRPDVFAVNFTGHPPARVYFNRGEPRTAGNATSRPATGPRPAGTPAQTWTYKLVTDKHAKTFGLCFADVDGDGRVDIVSGRHWYKNPGGDLMGDWMQSPPFPEDIEVCLAVDADDDGRIDLVGQKTEGKVLRVYWLRTEVQGMVFKALPIGQMEATGHPQGAQGYALARLNQARPAILMTSHGGLYYFQIPDRNPQAGMWPRFHVSANPSDEGLAVADFDGDGKADLCATTGESKRVEWYRNPGRDADHWEVHHVGDFREAGYPDRCAAADFDGDGRPDIVVTEENQGGVAQAMWWVNPGGRAAGPWPRRVLCRGDTMNAMDVGDVDGDGRVEIVLCEHRGQRRLCVFHNDRKGVFTRQVIDRGKEGHLGARLADLNADGRPEIVNICWDSPELIHLWRNETAGADAGTDRQQQP